MTVLTELTLASAQRQQLPPVNDEMWIMQFQNTILVCHILIFLEFGVVHYAARQMSRQKAKHKDDAEILRMEYGGYDGALDSFRSDVRSSDLGATGVGSARIRPQIQRPESVALDPPAAAAGFSTEEGGESAIGMDGIAGMLTESLTGDGEGGGRGCLRRCGRRRQEDGESEAMVPDLAAQGVIRARTWHRWAGSIDWLARFLFPPGFMIYYFWKMSSVDALWISLGLVETGDAQAIPTSMVVE